ncbi:hypothetical protein OPV22_014275 [Ensete ventricosum]|uniref:Uncharacterized protein n=1 Tax=Ensete ventricosum TaxID=4639 RepID=A0AAV8R2W5_ENSVE|nr:hypothetical protein OPV22_014275 [Ensete ventricosum]
MERFGSVQLGLADRAKTVESGLRDLEGERLRLGKSLEEKAKDANVLSAWLRVHGVPSMDCYPISQSRRMTEANDIEIKTTISLIII